ncbi:MAG TPA: hypothetical protein VNT99_20740, partial [Methylomirabilota bacterium]|nr:hypothetical protein [Methylomirabilota bacterium]
MRAHVAILLGVIIGILALVYLAGRKSSRSTTAAAAVTNTAPANVALRWKTRIPPATLAPEFEEPMEPPPSNFLQRANADDFDFHLTAEQKAEYLRQFGTNVETLLATQDTNYIRLAAQMFPHDPRVQFAVVGRDLFPEQRRE